MRRFHAASLLGLLVLALGCSSTRQSGNASWANRVRSLWAGLGPDAVQLELALITRPLGDRYLTDELWREIDEQVVSLDQRPNLEANGLRLGTISGNVPSGLQRLLTTEKLTCVQGHSWEIAGQANDADPLCPHCRLRAVNRESLTTARRRGIRAGESFFHTLGTADMPVKVQVHQDQEAKLLELDNAQAGIQFQLTPSDAGEVIIRGEPRIQYGSFLRLPQPSEDKGSWSITPGRPEKAFPKLAWEIGLEPDEYLVLGCWPEPADSFGQQCFTNKAAGTQSILVLRVARPQVDAKATAVATTSGSSGISGPLPLALQSILPKRPPPAVSRGQSGERVR
jgi:hypothetical protein